MTDSDYRSAIADYIHVAYTARQAPGLLRRFGFPETKIAAVVAAIG